MGEIKFRTPRQARNRILHHNLMNYHGLLKNAQWIDKTFEELYGSHLVSLECAGVIGIDTIMATAQCAKSQLIAEELGLTEEEE